MIRRAGPADAEAVAGVFTRSFEELLEFLPRLHTAEENLAFFRDLVLPGQEVWVAEEDARVVGFAALDERTLNHLFVDPEAQGRGVGGALLARAKERRPDGFCFWVFQQNGRARAFYERHGCRVVRLADGSGNEERTPDALYEWRPEPRGRLGEAASPGGAVAAGAAVDESAQSRHARVTDT